MKSIINELTNLATERFELSSVDAFDFQQDITKIMKNKASDTKREIAKKYCYTGWGQMLAERDKSQVIMFYNKLIKNLLGGTSDK